MTNYQNAFLIAIMKRLLMTIKTVEKNRGGCMILANAFSIQMLEVDNVVEFKKITNPIVMVVTEILKIKFNDFKIETNHCYIMSYLYTNPFLQFYHKSK